MKKFKPCCKQAAISRGQQHLLSFTRSLGYEESGSVSDAETGSAQKAAVYLFARHGWYRDAAAHSNRPTGALV